MRAIRSVIGNSNFSFATQGGAVQFQGKVLASGLESLRQASNVFGVSGRGIRNLLYPVTCLVVKRKRYSRGGGG